MKLEIINTSEQMPVNKGSQRFSSILSPLIVLICGFATGQFAIAQDVAEKPEAIEAESGVPLEATTGKKKTVRVNFEDQLIQGAADKPEVEYIFEKKQFNYRKLIRLRENFIPEAQSGMEELNAGE